MAEATDTRLKLLIERVENIEDDIRGMNADKKAVFDEAKAVGYDPKIMRQIIRERRKTAQERAEEEALRDTYAAAVGLA